MVLLLPMRFKQLTVEIGTPVLIHKTMQNRRWVWLTGTYNCTTQLVLSATAPTAAAPMQWVGADASGNVLRPKFDSTGMNLDLTNYPKIICSAM